MPPSNARLLIPVFETSQTFDSGLGLLQEMVAAGLVSLQDRVPVSKFNIQGPDQTLGDALRIMAKPGTWVGHFYTGHVARTLLSLDSTFFAKTDPPSDWLCSNLMGWALHDDRFRAGMSQTVQHDLPSSADEWTSAVLGSLPPFKLSNPTEAAGWEAMLKLGYFHSAVQVAGDDLAWWTSLDDRNQLRIRQCPQGVLWTKMLDAGVDPFHVMENGKPLWRNALPGSSSSEAIKGSMRATVEQWVTQQIAEGHPDPAFKAYVRKMALLRMAESTWMEAKPEAQSQWMDALPPDWHSWEHKKRPAWMIGFVEAGHKPLHWAQGLRLSNTPSLGELGDWAVDFAVRYPTRLPDPNEEPYVAPSIPSHLLTLPHAVELVGALGKIWGLNPTQMRAWVERHTLDEATPVIAEGSPAQGRRAPRL